MQRKHRHFVLVGLMGAGKTVTGRMLAKKTSLPFYDADNEIEKAAGCPVATIFEAYGEKAFREAERKVIQRLLESETPCVLATGGGSFMDKNLRHTLKERGITIWLKADIDSLLQRTEKSGFEKRPLLARQNPREALEKLMNERYPVYERADIIVDVSNKSIDKVAQDALNEIENYWK